MIVLVPFFVLLITSITILIMKMARPGFSYFWLLAVCGTLIAWVTVLIAKSWITISWTITTWLPIELFPASPTLLLDSVSWPFSLALATMILAATLTDVVHPIQSDQPRSSRSDIATWLATSAIGLLVILAGNAVALLLSWTVMDILELGIRLPQVRDKEQTDKIVMDFSLRICSLLIVSWAVMRANASGQSMSWEAITPDGSRFLFLAVLIRVGGLTVLDSSFNRLFLSRSNRILSKLVPAFLYLTVLPRLDPFDYSQVELSSFITYILILTWIGTSSIVCSLSWDNARDEIDGIPFWIGGCAALSLASCMLGQPVASIVWGIAMLLSGGLLFIFSLRRIWLLPLPLLGAISFTALPLTPTWQGASLYTSRFNLLTLILMIDHGLLLGGYIKHSLQPSSVSSKVERWTWIFLPAGLLLFLMVQIAIAWWMVASTTGVSLPSLPWTGWWPGLVIMAIAGLYLLWSLSGRINPSRLLLFSWLLLLFEWLKRVLATAFEFLIASFFRINLLLEGKSGLLWTMLILTLLLSITSNVLTGN